MNTHVETTIRVPAADARPRASGRRVGAVLETLLARWRLARARRAAIRELRSLGDRQLMDIGIERPQIEDVVNGLRRRRPQSEAAARLDRATAPAAGDGLRA